MLTGSAAKCCLYGIRVLHIRIRDQIDRPTDSTMKSTRIQPDPRSLSGGNRWWATAFASALALASPLVDAGLVASYDLNGDVLDSSGNGNDGTFEGTTGANLVATFLPDPMFGSVMDFDAKGAWIDRTA